MSVCAATAVAAAARGEPNYLVLVAAAAAAAVVTLSGRPAGLFSVVSTRLVTFAQVRR